MTKVTCSSLDAHDLGPDPAIVGFGKFDSHPERVCFFGQAEQDGKRIALFFGCDHELASQLLGQLMDYANVRQVSRRKDGGLNWTLGPSRPAKA